MQRKRDETMAETSAWAVQVAAERMDYEQMADVPTGLWNQLFDLADEIEGNE